MMPGLVEREERRAVVVMTVRRRLPRTSSRMSGPRPRRAWKTTRELLAAERISRRTLYNWIARGLVAVRHPARPRRPIRVRLRPRA